MHALLLQPRAELCTAAVLSNTKKCGDWVRVSNLQGQPKGHKHFGSSVK